MNIDTAAILADELAFDFQRYGWTMPNASQHGNHRMIHDAIDRISQITDNDGDFRTLLMDFSIRPIDAILADILEEYTTDLTARGIWNARDKPMLRDLHHGYILLCYLIEHDRDKLTELMMQFSLCPLHYIDWAICFDDDDDECAAIRSIFPHSHDT